MGEMRLVPLDAGDDEDVAFAYEVRSHPEVARFLFGLPPESMAKHRAWIRANVPSRRLMFLAKDGGRRVGYCHAIPGDEVEVGFAVHPSHQGNGYGGFMVDALVDVLRREMPGRKVVLTVMTGNERAVRLYERKGFVRREVFVRGKVEKAAYEWKGV